MRKELTERAILRLGEWLKDYKNKIRLEADIKRLQLQVTTLESELVNKAKNLSLLIL